MNPTEEMQPALFDLAACERHLVAYAADRARFTGTTTEKDARLVDSVLAAVVAGVPKEHIAHLAGISPSTVQGIIERAEDAGKIGGWKQRMSRTLARATESCAAGLVEDIENGRLAPGQKPVAIGILVDKKLLLDGEATSRVEVVARVTPEQLLAEMKRATVAVEAEVKRIN